MQTSLEVLFAPAEFAALEQRDLSGTECVVFDVLRATSSMVTALANGASAIVPVAEIPEALKFRASDTRILLAGERDGLRIKSDLTGGAAFDLGNSPREFTREKVNDKTIAMTTTNGTRALRACTRAKTVLAASFLNLRATADCVADARELILVCSGTLDQTAYEDVLAAGAMCDLLWPSTAPATSPTPRKSPVRCICSKRPICWPASRSHAMAGACSPIRICARMSRFACNGTFSQLSPSWGRMER